MNRQSVNITQKGKKSSLFPATDTLQRKKINRADFSASTVDTRGTSGQQIDKPRLSGTESHFNHDFSKIPVKLNSRNRIQAKLKIGQPDDKYEQEADRVAEQVMRMPEPRLSSSVGNSSLTNSAIPRGETIQRACASCSAEYKTAEDENRLVEPTNLCPKCRTVEQELIQTKQITPIIQAKTTGGVTSEVTPAINFGIQSLQGGGQPLSGSERSFFEPRFEADFSNVRVHNDTRAADVAQSVNARAFTLGHNVVFGAEEYSSDTLAGRKLLAHELTHVVQQSGDSRLARPELIQRVQTGRPTSQASYFTYELDATRSTYDALASYYGLDRWEDIRDATPGRPEDSRLRIGQAVRIPARNLPTGTVQVVGTEPALVVSTGTIGVNFRWGNNLNANRIGRASRGTATNVGEAVPNNFRRAWIESANLQNRAYGVIAELQARNRTAGNNVYGYLSTPNVRLASRDVPTTDVDILARMIFGEQRDQGRAAMVVAAWIVRNRYDAGWGGSYAVLLTDREFHALRTTRAQNMTRLTGADARLWTSAQGVAQGVVDRAIADPTGGHGFYFGNGRTVQQRMDFCRRNTTGYHTAQVAGTNLFWSNGDYTGGTVAAPQCGQPQRR